MKRRAFRRGVRRRGTATPKPWSDSTSGLGRARARSRRRTARFVPVRSRCRSKNEGQPTRSLAQRFGDRLPTGESAVALPLLRAASCARAALSARGVARPAPLLGVRATVRVRAADHGGEARELTDHTLSEPAHSAADLAFRACAPAGAIHPGVDDTAKARAFWIEVDETMLDARATRNDRGLRLGRLTCNVSRRTFHVPARSRWWWQWRPASFECVGGWIWTSQPGFPSQRAYTPIGESWDAGRTFPDPLWRGGWR